MSDLEYAKIISENLKKLLTEHNKSQADLARDLHISKATISSWVNGTRVPRMKKIDLLCHYFNVGRVDIMENNSGQSISRNLSPDECELLDDYQELNEDGQDTARTLVNALTHESKYKKSHSAQKWA